MSQVTVKQGHVTTEGDTLYYEVRGKGEPLLMISAAGGNGDFYTKVANILADEYQVITYDRRANGRSTRNTPQNFELSQQSRDAIAVLKAAGLGAAYMFGNSAGAIIALDLIKHFSQTVKGVIAHEPPLARFHPDKTELLGFFAEVYKQGVTESVDKAMETFAGAMFSLDMRSIKWNEIITMPFAEFGRSVKESNDFFIRNEILPVTNYEIDLASLKANASKIITAAGKQSVEEKRFYAETAPQLAQTIGCDYRSMPGHHMSFLDDVEEWTMSLREILHHFKQSHSGKDRQS